MYMLSGWWFLSSSGSYPPVFIVDCMPTWELSGKLILPQIVPRGQPSIQQMIGPFLHVLLYPC